LTYINAAQRRAAPGWGMSSTPTPKRFATSASTHTRVSALGVALAVHDSAPHALLPTILCLPAVGHAGADFAALEARLGAEYRVVTVDFPGQGRSDADHEPASAERYTALIEALVPALGLHSFVLLGNSIGGAVAVRYAAAHPARVRALVLCNSGGLDRNPGGFLPRLFIGQVVRNMERGARGDAGFARWFARYYATILITPEARDHRARIVAAGYELAPVLASAWRSFARASSDVRDLAASLTMPVLVAWALRDRTNRWSRNRAAIARIPNARVALFEAGHSAFLETPDAFAHALRAFLAPLAEAI
jgi:pimeloyl-ACP methyl ester carboxylesterase